MTRPDPRPTFKSPVPVSPAPLTEAHCGRLRVRVPPLPLSLSSPGRRPVPPLGPTVPLAATLPLARSESPQNSSSHRDRKTRVAKCRLPGCDSDANSTIKLLASGMGSI
jgi:hypothetical protein